MTKNKIRTLSVAIGLVATFVMAITMLMSAPRAALAMTAVNTPGASNTTAATVVVSGGNLTILAPNTLTFPAATLSGVVQNITNTAGTFSLAVVDARGTAPGWHVTLGATQFTGSSNTLATTALSVVNVAKTMTDATGTDVTGNTIDPSTAVPTGAGTPVLITVGTPSTIYNAAATSGMGSFALDTTLKLNLPASVKPDTYTSTLTVTAVTLIA